MPEPNLNSYEWPKTPTGNVDWECLFEDPETGLIPYIEGASAPMTLRLNAVQVIQSLFTRRDDEGEIERLSDEINELIPDDMADNRFPVPGYRRRPGPGDARDQGLPDPQSRGI